MGLERTGQTPCFAGDNDDQEHPNAFEVIHGGDLSDTEKTFTLKLLVNLPRN